MVHEPATTRIHAWLRATVTLRLLEELPQADVLSTAPGRRSVQIRTPGGPAVHITIRDGRVRFHDHPRPFPGVTLLFPKAEHLVATLTGGQAPVVPLPSSPRFLAAIAAFRGLTAKLRERFADPELRPRLLLLATLYGVEVVANRDPYVAPRVARIPEGTIAVAVEGDERVRGWLRKRDGLITSGAGDLPNAPAQATAASPPNAILEFADRDAAIALLTGATPAMLALAERSVRIHGRLPMIQNLFPVLDRVSDYLGG